MTIVSVDFFDSLMKHSVDALALSSRDSGVVLQVSDSFCELTGHEREALVGRSLRDLGLLDPFGARSMSNMVGSGGGAVGVFETQIECRSGEVRWVECSHQLVEGECYLTIARDLTARRFAERRLLESEERFRVSFENAPIGKALIALDGRYLQVNEAFSRITGYSAEQIRLCMLADVTHTDDLAADLAGMGRLLTGEVDTYSLEKRYLTATGGEIWAAKSASLVRDHDGTPLYFIGQIQDITGRKRQEQVLHEERRRLREAQFVGRLGSWELDLETNRVTRSDGLLELVGWEREKAEGDLSAGLETAHPEDRELVERAFRVCTQTGESLRLRFRIIRPDGQQRWVESRAERYSRDGKPVRLAGTVADVTEAVLTEAASAAQQEVVRAGRRHEALLSALVQGVVVFDVDGTVITANSSAAELFGLRTEERGGRPRMDPRWRVVDARGNPLPRDQRPASRALRDRTPVRNTTVGIVKPGGETSWLDCTAVPVLGADGRPECVILGLSDVTGARRAELALAESEELFGLAFESAPVGMAMIGLSGATTGRLLRVNSALAAFTQRTPEELQLLDLDAITHPDEADANRIVIARLGAGRHDGIPVEKRFRRADGSTVHGLLGLSYLPATANRDACAICLIQDITGRKQAEAALQHQALHDPLTGLPNRILLYDRIEHALARSRRSAKPVGMLYLDIDGFKQVNDISGHAAGDELLVQTAARLRHTVRPGDTVARLGGDEFAIVCVDIDDVGTLLGIADRVLASCGVPFQLTNCMHQVSASIGIQLVAEATDADQVLATADTAMYGAKSAGGNRIGAPSPDEQDRVDRAVRLQRELQRAVTDDEFVMYGQPLFDLATGHPVAVECLIRWHHPVRGVLPPSEFLAMAERSPMMIAIGRRVLTESCRMAAGWCERFGSDAPNVHINVSGRQLESGHFSADVLNALAIHGLPASRLVLELTETHLPAIADSLSKDLNRLRERGVRIAIDDVGTGYSSLARITELPVDMLKIDLKFVAGLGVDRACDAVVRAVLSLGSTMGLPVVAEGVETPQQADLLRSYGCDTVQGYLYSPPRPETDLLHHLAASADRAANRPKPANG